jgi:beta-fructofuranosidase
MKLEDGRTILMAWKQMWDRTLVTQADNWVGSYTLPRELSLKENHIYQSPIKELENYRQNGISYANKVINNSLILPNVSGTKLELDLQLEIGNAKVAGIKLFKGTYNETLVYYDAVNGNVVFDRSRSGKSIAGVESNDSTRSEKVSLIDGKLNLRIFLDVSSVEVFINDGYVTMTSNVYPDEADTGIEFYTKDGSSTITSLQKYDIVVS